MYKFLYEHMFLILEYISGVWKEGKESACNAGDLGLIPGLGRCPGAGHGNSLQYSCLKNPCGLRTLVGYGPWGHKESDMTEQLSTHTNSELFHLSFYLTKI